MDLECKGDKAGEGHRLKPGWQRKGITDYLELAVEGFSNRVMCVSIFCLDGVRFNLGCLGTPKHLSMLHLWRVGAVVKWDRQNMFQQNPAPSPEDYCPVIPRGKGWVMYLWLES